jgi:hypothetical protein
VLGPDNSQERTREEASEKFEDRPWVGMTALALSPPIPLVGKPIEAHATLINTGRTPAKNLKGFVVFEGVTAGQAPNFNYLGVNATHVVHSGVSGNNGGYHTNPAFLEALPNESSS